LALAAAIALLWTAAGYTQEPPPKPPKPTGSYVDGVFVENYVYKPNFISAQELKKLIDEKSKDIVIVDTAAAVIFDEQHIPGAVNFPYAPTLPQPITLPRTKTLVIYCACNAEEESIDTAKKLTEYGYQNLKVLKGGWSGWLDLGYPIVTQAPAPPASEASAGVAGVVAGLAPGTTTSTVPVLDVTGPYAGKRICYVCDFQDDPNVIAFFRDADDRTAELIVQLDKLYRQEKTKNFKAVAILVSGPDVAPWLKELSKSRIIEMPLTVLAQGPKDIGYRAYKLNPKVANTFLVTRNRVVEQNVSDIGPSGFDKVQQAASTMLTNATTKQKQASPSQAAPASAAEVKQIRTATAKQIPTATTKSIRTVTPEQIRTVTAKQIRALVDGSKGKVVVVNFFASWCPPCVREFPAIIKVYDQYHDKGLDVFAVSLNAPEETAEIKQFLQTYKPPFRIYRAAAQDETFTSGVLKDWSGEMPMTLVFNAAGERVLAQRSELTYEQLSSKVKALLPVR
jgi:thiol-disulfide isomerase/thioredoxin/rhodanese-related sulfurtransferase